MTEPRQRLRQKGLTFTPSELSTLLHAFGDSAQPLGATTAILDEILTDFIIETCHVAALCASYSRRQKIKADDFKWVLRRDERLLGHVLFRQGEDRELKRWRANDLQGLGGGGGAGRGAVEELEELAGEFGEEGGEGKRRGRKKRKIEG